MSSQPLMQDPEQKLEEHYLIEYLALKGYTLEQARLLPPLTLRELMIDAGTYAANKVAEVEQRARIMGEIHGVADET